MDQSCADLVACGEVAWYGCECGDCHRRTAFGSEVWANIVCNEAYLILIDLFWKERWLDPVVRILKIENPSNR